MWPRTEARTQNYAQKVCKRAQLSNDYSDHSGRVSCGGMVVEGWDGMGQVAELQMKLCD